MLPTPIPDKGRVLTACSLYWYEQVADILPNHLISADRADFPAPHGDEPDLAGRSMLVRTAKVILMECVVRGYLTGSGWSQYKEGGEVCGVSLPDGLVESARLPEPIFTPTTKAAEGHDMPLTPRRRATWSATGSTSGSRRFARDLRADRGGGARPGDHRRRHEVRVRVRRLSGDLTLIDEVGTPDSSRFWPADRYEPGRGQPSFDKQYVRDYLDATGWDHEPPPPTLPDDVVEATAARYREAYEVISGEPFDAYLKRMGA